MLSREQLATELRSVGFSRVDVRGLSGITFRYVESAVATLVLPLYNAYEEVIRRSPFEKALGTFLVSIAQKS